LLQTLALLLACALAGCGSAQPTPLTVTIVSALPLFLGEGGATAVLNGPDQRAPIITALSEVHTLRPVATVSAEALTGGDVLLLAQPRALSPEELVALDAWVRGGGRALVFADPRLDWSSRFPLGDPRRAPPVTLLDPLLTHWGLTLEAADEQAEAETLTLGDLSATLSGAGRWLTTGSGCTVESEARLADCQIGKGHALLLADADLLDLDGSDDGDRRSMVEALLARAAGH
jgi:hypothetical protein